MKNIKTATVNYKEITIDGYTGKYLVSCFDTERRQTTFSYTYKTIKQANECFQKLIEIQQEKLHYQF